MKVSEAILNIPFLSSPLAVKRGRSVTSLLRCMFVRACVCASVRPDLSRP